MRCCRHQTKRHGAVQAACICFKAAMSCQSTQVSQSAAGLTPEHNAGIDFTCKESYLDDDEFAKVTLAAWTGGICLRVA